MAGVVSGRRLALLLLVGVAHFCFAAALLSGFQGGGGIGDREEKVEAVKKPEADLRVSVNNRETKLFCGEGEAEARRRTPMVEVFEHPSREKACESLAYVDDLALELKPPAPGNDKCVKEVVKEQVVKIEGKFKGRSVMFERTFRNKCQLNEVAPEVLYVDIPTGGPCLTGQC